MPDIDALFENSERLPVTYRGIEMVVWFNPNIITGRQLADWSAELDEIEMVDSQFYPIIARRLAMLLVDWDFTRKGEKVPINQENCLALPGSLLNHLFNKIMEAMRPGESQGTSGDGAGRPESPDRSLTGTSSFG